MTEPQDGALVGHARELWELGKFPVQRHIKERLFHARIRQGEPLLQKVRSQHGRQREGWAPLLAFGVVRRDQIDQRLPWDNFVHLLKEFALASFLHAQAQLKACLFHGSMMPGGAYARHTGSGLLQSFLSYRRIYGHLPCRRNLPKRARLDQLGRHIAGVARKVLLLMRRVDDDAVPVLRVNYPWSLHRRECV